jgi:hypothetical protein
MHPKQQQPGNALPADNVLLDLPIMGRGAWERQWDFCTTRL